MAYPFLYATAISLLPKLELSYLSKSVVPNDMINTVSKWKDTLTFLPSITETQGISDIEIGYVIHFVFRLQYFLSGVELPYEWDVVLHELRKYEDRLRSQIKTVKVEKSLFSPSTFVVPIIHSPDVKVEALPSHLLPCLAYCALYPKGYDIVRETLVNQWMAEGFLDTGVGEYGDMELENIGDDYFNELLSRGVFVEPRFCFGGRQAVYSCKMHPLVHDEACRIASKEVLVLGEHGVDHSAAHSRARRLVAIHKDDGDVSEVDKAITTYMSFTGRQMKEVPIRSSNLRVLHLAETHIDKLHTTFDRPIMLRYLALSRNTILKRLDDINWCSLPHLQTLAVDGCVQLEEVSLEKFVNLKHMYWTSKQTTLDISTSTLRILQLSHCQELRSLSLREGANFRFLRRLRIFDCPRLVSLPDCIDLLISVDELILHNCARLDLNYGRSMSSLPKLLYTELIGLPKLTVLPAGLQSARVLHYLMIADCKSLRSTDDVLQHLHSLQKLCVYDCPNLSISPNVLQSLTALQSLDIRNCPKMTSTCTVDAGKAQAPFISDIPEIILDGQRLLDQKPDLELQFTPLRAQTDFRSPRDVPYFILSSETFKAIKSSQGLVDEEYKLKMASKWVVLALAYRVIKIMKMRALRRREPLKLYCCLFPDEFEFERDTVVQLWMAEGLLQDGDEIMELKGKYRFDCLLAEEYILPSRTDILTDTRKYKINVDKVNNTLLNTDLYTLIKGENIGVDTSTTPWHVSLLCDKIDQTHSIFLLDESISIFEKLKNFKELRTLLFIRDYGSSLSQIPSTLFQGLQFMPTLDLSRSHISELPTSIGNMTQLHFLDLSFTLIERIPESIHLLQELQTLKLKGCKNLHTLPKGMKELLNLRHLDFDILGQLTCMPKGLGSLTKLRTLSAFIVSEEDGCSVRELENMNNLDGSFCISGLEYASSDDAWVSALQDKKHLTKLELRWKDSKLYDAEQRCDTSSTLENLKPPSSLEELRVSYFPGLDLPKWMQENSKDLEKLASMTLLKWQNNGIINLDWLQHLRYLNITDMNRVTKIRTWDHVKSIRFPKLETLSIDGMLSLESWTGVKVSDCPCLSKLSVKHCPKFTALAFLPFLKSLKHLEISHCRSFRSLPDGVLSPSLETLIIDNCPLLKTRCSKEGEDWHKIQHVPNIWIDLKDIHSAHQDTDSLSSDGDFDYSEDSD